MRTVLLGHIVVSCNSMTPYVPPLLHWRFTLYLDKNDNKNKKNTKWQYNNGNWTTYEIIIIKSNKRFNWFSIITFKPLLQTFGWGRDICRLKKKSEGREEGGLNRRPVVYTLHTVLWLRGEGNGGRGYPYQPTGYRLARVESGVATTLATCTRRAEPQSLVAVLVVRMVFW
jgi:hypothetical protein